MCEIVPSQRFSAADPPTDGAVCGGFASARFARNPTVRTPDGNAVGGAGWTAAADLDADEHSWRVPERWWALGEPAGYGAGWSATIDGAATARLRTLLYDSTARLRGVLEDPRSDPAAARSALAVLDSRTKHAGGCAVIAALLARLLPAADREHIADLLVEEFGFDVAAETVVRIAEVRVHLGVGGAEAGEGPDSAWIAAGSPGREDGVVAILRRLRALLTGADSRSRARVVTALSSCAVTAARRRLSAYLLPQELVVVAGALADPSHDIGMDWTVDLLFASVTTAGQAADIAASCGIAGPAADPRLLYTLAARVGPDAAPLVAACLDDAEDGPYRHGVAILATFPTDRAFGLLIERLPDPRAEAALRTAVEAFPRRASRLLAAAARGGGPGGERCARMVSDHLGAAVIDPARCRPWLDLTTVDPVAPLDALRLVTLLSGTGHAFADTLLARLDPADRAEFGWTVFERWYAAGMPPGEAWVWSALRRTADDPTCVRLTDRAMADADPAFSDAVVAVLAGVASETALTQLIRLSRDTGSTPVRAEAEAAVTAVAALLGLDSDRLDDRRVPLCGVTSEGSLRLADGTRLLLRGPSARPDDELRFLPRRIAHPSISARIARVERELDVVAAQQARRLECAMVTRRTWHGHELRTVLFGHPVLRHLVRLLVWVVLDETGAAVRPFLIDRDGEARDEYGRPLDPAEATVAIAHPLDLGRGPTTWHARFAAARIRQPFAQLDRTVYRLTASEAAACSLPRFADRLVATTALRRLESRGWRTGPVDAGPAGQLFRPVSTGLHVRVAFADGLSAPCTPGPEQVLTAVDLTVGPPRSRGHRCGRARFGALDPITASEVLRDLEGLVA